MDIGPIDELITNLEAESAEFENPDGSVWIIGVDMHQNISIVQPPPGVWDGFYSEYSAEENGFPPDTTAVGPGVYRVRVSFTETSRFDGEGYDEWWEFDFVEWTPLWVSGEGGEHGVQD